MFYMYIECIDYSNKIPQIEMQDNIITHLIKMS